MFKVDQKGISLPIVLAVAAIIGANTYYFMTLQRTASINNAITGTDITEDAEKKRLLGILSDFDVCTKNFGGKSVSVLSDSTTSASSTISPIKKGTTTVLEIGTDFRNNTGSPAFQDNTLRPTGLQQTLKVGKIYFNELKFDPDLPTDPPQQVRFSLRVEYDILADSSIQKMGKKVVVSLPLYVELDSYPTPIPPLDTRKVVRCYARPDNATTATGLFQAIEASCLPTASTAHLNTSGCSHSIEPIDCKALAPVGYKFMNTVGIDSTTNAITFKCGIFEPTSTDIVTQCESGKIAQAVIDSVISCNYPDACVGGGALLKNSGEGHSCLQKCPASQVWHSTDSSGNYDCYDRTEPCPAGEYAKSVDALTGEPACQAIPNKNVSCTATQFAKNVNLGSATPLECAAFSKTQVCSSLPKFSYIRSFSVNPPDCVTAN